MTCSTVKARDTETPNQGNRTVLATKVGVTVTVIVVYLINACAMLAGIIAITFINIDFTVCTLKAWITFAGIGANLEKNRKVSCNK